jgi:hypothetical protein
MRSYDPRGLSHVHVYVLRHILNASTNLSSHKKIAKLAYIYTSYVPFYL